MRAGPLASRRAFVSGAVIMTTGVLVLFVAITARMAFLEMTRERTAAIESHVAQAMLSARAWSRTPGRSFEIGDDVELPLAELVPRGYSGTLRLRLVRRGDAEMIECRLTLKRGSRELTRQADWPLPAHLP